MARTMVALRLGEGGLKTIDGIVKDTGSSRSAVLRVLLGEALRSKETKAAAIYKLKVIKETL